MWLNLKIIILEWTHEEYIPSPSLTTTMSLCRRLRMSLKNDDDSFFGIFMTKTPLKISLPHQISVRSSRVFISSNYQSSSSTTSREDNGSRLPNCKVVLPKSAKEAKQHQQHQDPAWGLLSWIPHRGVPKCRLQFHAGCGSESWVSWRWATRMSCWHM